MSAEDIKITIQFHERAFSPIHTNGKDNNILSVPKPGVDFDYDREEHKLTYIENYIHSDTLITLDLHELGLRPRAKLDMSSMSIVFYKTDEGRPKFDVSPLATPQWMHEIRHELDIIKNPTNEHLHKYLDDRDVPKYISERLYITFWDTAYVKLGDVWLPIQGGLNWMDTHRSLLPYEVYVEYDRYVLSVQLQK